MLLVFGLTMGGTTAFYTYTTYMPTFLVNTVKLSARPGDANLLYHAGDLCRAAAGVRSGFGCHRATAGADVVRFGTLGTVPMLTTLGATHSYLVALGLIMAALLVVSGYTSINAVVKADCFPPGCARWASGCHTRWRRRCSAARRRISRCGSNASGNETDFIGT